jgi:6-phosphogluconolactonase
MISMIYGVSGTEEEIAVVAFDDVQLTMTKRQSLPLGFGAQAICFAPDNRHLYVACGHVSESGEPNGRRFAVSNDGTIDPGEPLSFAHGYSYLSQDRTGRFLLGVSYVTGHIDVYELTHDAWPRLVSSRGDRPTEAHAVALSPDNRFAYVPFVKSNNALLQYAFDARNGTMTPLDPLEAEVRDDIGPRHPVFHPTGPYVYFSNEQQLGVSVYRTTQSGQLELLQVCPANATEPEKGLDGSAIVITPDGRFVFAAVRGFGRDYNAVIGYEVLDDGTVTPIGETPTDAIPWIIRLGPDARHLLVSAARGETLTAYRIEEDGALTRQGALRWGEDFWDMAVHAIAHAGYAAP